MKLLVVAVGQRVPDWAQTAWDDYAKRFPPELKLELRAVKTEPRGSKSLETLYAAERERIEAAIAKGMRIVVLDERGTALTTKALAARLQAWQGAQLTEPQHTPSTQLPLMHWPPVVQVRPFFLSAQLIEPAVP